MTDDELNERLRRLGRRETPPVDGAFANRLEADLRATQTEPVRGFAIPDMLLRPAAVIAALVVVLGVFAVVQRDGDTAGVAMVAADGTTVSIPGGTSFEPGRAGLDLPDGTRIEVADGGAAVVAGVVLEAGSTAIVVDGRLEVLESPAVTATESPTTTSVPATDPTVAPDSTDSAALTTTDQPPRTTVPSTTVPPTTSPSTTDPDPAPTTTTTETTAPTTTTEPVETTVAPSPTTTRAPTTSTTETRPSLSPDEPAIALAIGPVVRNAATLTWQVDGPTDAIAGWEVRIVRGDTVKTIAFIRVADARRLRVEVPGPRVAYRVIARSGGDGVVARSALVSPGG